jgi:hypothetical protein
LSKSKTLATWLALTLGAFGAHRIYLHGVRDRWAWLHPWPTLAGLAGLQRMQAFGQDDKLAWLLLPLLGLMIAQACGFALRYGLMSNEAWAARHGASLEHARWGPVLGAVAALALGATALMATIAFGSQRFFEWQVEQSRALSR